MFSLHQATKYISSHIILTASILAVLTFASVGIASQLNQNDSTIGQIDTSDNIAKANQPNKSIKTPAVSDEAETNTTEEKQAPVTESAAKSTAAPVTTNKPASSLAKQYQAPVCVRTPISFTNSYQLAPYLSAGQLSMYGGTDGFKESCTPDSNGFSPAPLIRSPINRVINVGDGGGSLSVASPARTTPYDEVYSRALPACDELLVVTGNEPNARQWCLDNVVAGILHYYGY